MARGFLLSGKHTHLAEAAGQNGTLRATGPDAPPPFPQLEAPSRVVLQREYVSGGGWGWYGGRTARTLPNAIDDITSDFGDDIYERMLLDPQVSACVTVYKASILETGPNITSVVTDKDDPEFDLAKEITDQCIRMLADLETPFSDVLWNMLDSAAVGNKVAEKLYAEAAAIKTGRQILNLQKLKVKSRRTTLYAVDNYLNLVGLLVAVPPNAEPVPGTTYFVDGNTRYGLLSTKKFVVSCFRPKDSDPRGTSIIRPAYTPWWRKQQIIPEYLKYLSQFAGPSLIGVAAPDADPIPDPNNPGQTISQTQAMLAALELFRNMSAIAVANGAEVHPINMQGDGAAFRSGMGDANEEITKAILTQQLATDEGKHMARAAATVHQDVLDTLVRQGKLSEQDMIRNQMFRPWVILNWGQKVAHLAPIADLGATEQRDKPGLWQGAAALANAKYFTEDQLQSLDAMLGLPIRQKLTALAFTAVKAQMQQKSAGTNAPGAQPASPTDQQPADQTPPDPNRVPVRPHDRAKPQPKPAPAQPDNAKEKQPA